MDETEISKNANDFPSLFGPDGLFKDKQRDFDKNQKEFNSLNEKEKKLKEEYSKLKEELKVWVQRKGQLISSKTTVNNTYSSEVSSEDQGRYAIAQEFIDGWSACLNDIQDCQKKCNELEKIFEESIQNDKNNMNGTLDQLSKISLSVGRFHTYLFKYLKQTTRNTKSRSCCNFGFFFK